MKEPMHKYRQKQNNMGKIEKQQGKEQDQEPLHHQEKEHELEQKQ